MRKEYYFRYPVHFTAESEEKARENLQEYLHEGWAQDEGNWILDEIMVLCPSCGHLEPLACFEEEFDMCYDCYERKMKNETENN